MKYKALECECCSFYAVIPDKNRHEDLLCPFCNKCRCNEGKFKEIFVSKIIEILSQ